MATLQHVLGWATLVSMGLLFVGQICIDFALRRLFGHTLLGDLSDGALLSEMKEANRKHFLRNRRRLMWLKKRKGELPEELSPRARHIILADYLSWVLGLVMLISFWTALLIQEGYI